MCLVEESLICVGTGWFFKMSSCRLVINELFDNGIYIKWLPYFKMYFFLSYYLSAIITD